MNYENKREVYGVGLEMVMVFFYFKNNRFWNRIEEANKHQLFPFFKRELLFTYIHDIFSVYIFI